jgi:hypothetical protein
MFWMRSAGTMTNTPNTSPGAMIFDGGDINDNNPNGIAIIQDDAGNIFAGNLVLNAGSTVVSGSAVFLESAAPVSNNAWHHVAVTYDQSIGGTLNIFIDGNSDSATPNFSAWSWPTNQAILLGSSHKTNWRAYNGLLADFRIYNRILTPGEIATIHSSNALVDTSALQEWFNFNAPPATGLGLNWTCGATLQSAVNAAGPYSDVSVATSPWPVTTGAASKFFRIKH